MLAKSIVALFIISVISLTATLSPRGLGDLVKDKGKELTLSLLDKKIVSWYASHGGDVPESTDNRLSQEQLEAMNSRFLDIQDIIYIKQAPNLFSLTTNLADGTVISSVNSGKVLLPVIRDSL